MLPSIKKVLLLRLTKQYFFN